MSKQYAIAVDSLAPAVTGKPLKVELKEMFESVESRSVAGQWSFECQHPKSGTMDEAYVQCERRYFEVGKRNA